MTKRIGRITESVNIIEAAMKKKLSAVVILMFMCTLGLSISTGGEELVLEESLSSGTELEENAALQG